MENRGMSLVETMVAMAIVMASIMAVADIMESQNHQAAVIADRLAALELERHLTGVLADGSVCNLMVTSAPPVAFNPADAGSLNVPAFTQIPSRGVAGALSAATAGPNPVSALSPRVCIGSIQLRNFQCAAGPCNGDSNLFNAELEVAFDTTRTMVALPPLRFPVQMRSAGTTGNHTLSGCVVSTSAAGGGSGFRAAVPRITVLSPAESCGGQQDLSPDPSCHGLSVPAVATCPAGYVRTGCGYNLSTWNPTSNGGVPPFDTWHSNSPDEVMFTPTGESCVVIAGGAPGCGVCFRAQAICLKFD